MGTRVGRSKLGVSALSLFEVSTNMKPGGGVRKRRNRVKEPAASNPCE
jgi:hypothetical protein